MLVKKNKLDCLDKERKKFNYEKERKKAKKMVEGFKKKR